MPHRLVTREVLEPLTGLVRELAAHYWSVAVVRGAPRGLVDLCEQAHHLLEPFEDWQTPARAAGWLPEPGDTLGRVYFDITQRDGEDEAFYHAADWQEACNRTRLDPAVLPVLECWSVTDWLGDRLVERGERVGDLAGLFVWARTTAEPLQADELLRSIWLSASEVPKHDGDEA